MRSYSRQVLQPTSDTGIGLNGSDTGPHTFGEIVQMRFVPTDVDTGGDLVLTALIDTSDTGQGWDFFDDNDCLGAQFTRVPLQMTHHSDGRDTGADQQYPVVLSGERIRAKFVAGQAECAGKVYIWVRH